MGVREEKKKRLQQKIEEAAKKLFLENDFDDVTMSQIAKEANVGLGTAYNYYSSKEELFLIAGGTAFIFGAGMTISKQTATLEELVNQISEEMKQLTKIDRMTWRISLSSLTKAAEKNPSLFLDLVNMDYQFIDSIREVIFTLQAKKEVKLSDIEALMELIYHTLFSSFLMYIYQETMKVEQLETSIKQQLTALLEKSGE